MRDAGEQDQSRVHTGFLKLRNSRFRRAKGRDLIVARMNCENRKPPPGGRFRWRTGDGNCRAETLREFLRKMPGPRTTHTVTGDGDLPFVDGETSDHHVEQ